MIKLEKITSYGWEPSLRGMRNALNSWDRADSTFEDGTPHLGENDRSLMKRLLGAGAPSHCKFRRMIGISVDVTGPFYWWKEFDTYKVGTTTNSCSTMHTLMKSPITIDDFSTDQMKEGTQRFFEGRIQHIEKLRQLYVKHAGYAKEYKDNARLYKVHHNQAQSFWYEVIQLLPSSFNQKRTVALNYEVMANIYRDRRHHKLNEWHVFIDQMIDHLPEPWIFAGEQEER